MCSTFYLGPQVDFLAGYSDNIERFYLPGSSYFYWADDDDLRNFVFGITSGFSFEYEMKSSAIGIELSRAFSFNPAFDARDRRDAYGGHGFYMKLRDNVFVVNLIYVRKKKSN